VAAPSCYLTSLERLFATIGPQDAEQNITGQVALGLEHADYIGLRATKPTLLCAATRDFFDIQGTWTSFREAKRLYTIMGHPERLDILESNTGHGWPTSHREGMARWMLRWLAGKDEAVVEGDFKIEKDADLLCTRTGQVLDDLKGVSTFGLNLKRARELREWRGDVTKEDVAKLLGVKLPGAAADNTLGKAFESAAGSTVKMVFETERGVKLPALLCGKEGGPLVVYVHDGGKEVDMGGPISRRVKAGQRVLALDLRGWGETAPAPMPKKPGHFGNDFREAYLALHLGRPLLGQRVHDLLSIIAKLDEKVEVVGVGKGGLVALHAAALSDKITKVRVVNALVSWENVVETPLSIDQLTQAVPGALAKYDLPQLAKMIAPRKLEIVNPVDATGKPLSADAAKKAYAGLKTGFTLKVGEKP
jgi:pimeloyl-ACP methyl ester carboxylesterase